MRFRQRIEGSKKQTHSNPSCWTWSRSLAKTCEENVRLSQEVSQLSAANEGGAAASDTSNSETSNLKKAVTEMENKAKIV